jgi:hypothetical protein
VPRLGSCERIQVPLTDRGCHFLWGLLLPGAKEPGQSRPDGLESDHGLAGRARLLRRRNGVIRQAAAGSGFQPAMVRAQARASALSVTPGNRRRSQLALLLIGGADRSGIGFGDEEHGDTAAGRQAAAGQSAGKIHPAREVEFIGQEATARISRRLAPVLLSRPRWKDVR